jgi:hypothetical protein
MRLYSEFLRFDLRFLIGSPLLWIAAFVFGLSAFGATSSDAIQIGGSIGNVHRNAPFTIVQWLNIFTLLGLFVAGAFIGGTLLRDFETGTSELFFSKPIKATDYLLGRFSAGVIVSLLIYLGVCLGMIVGAAMPWIDAARLGPFSLAPFAYGIGVFVLPNLVFTGALILLFAALMRSVLGVYIAIIAFMVLWGVAGEMTRDLDNLWFAALADPFGARALNLTTRYWTAEERNTQLPALAGYILANRALWLAVASALIFATLKLFRTQRAGTSRWLRLPALRRSKAKDMPTAATALSLVRVPPPQASGWPALRQYLRQTRFDTARVVGSAPFLIMLAFGLLNLSGTLEGSAPMYDTPLYPTTARMLIAIPGAYAWLLLIIVMFYAGELVWRERDAKLDGVIDAFPVPNWVPLAAKATAIVAVVALFLAVAAVWCMAYQLLDGTVALEPLLYLKGLAIAGTGFVLLGWLSLAFQVYAHHKFLGYLLTIGIVVSQMVLAAVDFDHNLVAFGATPATPYSDMNGYGHFLVGWGWFSLHWTLFTLAALVLAAPFWVRGTPEPWRRRAGIALSRLKGGQGALLAGLLLATCGSGAWILYNTTVLNRYQASDTALDRRAEYEKTWRPEEDRAQPRILATDSRVDLFPEQRRVLIDGHYRMHNPTAEAIPELLVYLDADLQAELSIDGAELLRQDDFGMRVYAFDTPLAAGAEFRLDYRIEMINRGFTNSGAAGNLHHNGTFFNNRDYFPSFGYQRGLEITDRNERRKRGLGEPRRLPKLESPRQDHSYISNEADWIDFATTVCTHPSQTAIAPGYLQREWNEDGRRCFRYEMDSPILAFWAYLSADWQVKRDTWNDVALEVYYDDKHAYNVDRMLEASRKSLSYFHENFAPYQHRQFRIIEFPGYAQFAQAFPNTIPFSEAIGFIANVDAEDALDYVFYVTAHEAAHQWWAHQVVGAASQGATVLSETLAQYSALMVMEREYGRERMRKFLKYELDAYLRGRGGEIVEELPLYKVESSQGYVHYRKGSLVMYRLKDEIGEEAVNLALRNFLSKHRFGSAPYPLSTDLLAEFRAVAPADKQALITDLFEHIVFYDNRAEEATARKLDDGRFEVTLTWKAAKKESDGIGKETDRALEDDIEIGIFARDEGDSERDERVLYLQRQRITDLQGQLTVVVEERPYEAGIDPYNKLIDRVSVDNRKRVSIE